MKGNIISSLAILVVTLAVINASLVEVHPKYNCAFASKECNGHDWVLSARATPETIHTVLIAVSLKKNAAATCDSLIYQSVSNSTAPHLSLDEINKIFRSNENMNAVTSFLEKKGLDYVVMGDFIKVSAPVSLLESVFAAQFHHFVSKSTGKHITRTKKYVIPKEIDDKIDFVSNTVIFPPAKSHIIAVPNFQNGMIVPSSLNSIYGIKNNKVASTKATQSLFEALGQQFSPDDLTSFQKQYNLPQQKIAKVVGNNDPSQCGWNPNNCAEANLDVQYMLATAQGAPTWFWNIDSSSQDPFYDWVVALSTTANPPLVHSISYGSIATEDPKNDMLRFNTEICKLGLRGVTIFVSSGDDGVANFEARGNPSACGFNPSFPATSPYVVAVGATQGPESGKPEIACSSTTGGIITTGGGFSIYFDRPSYQETVVSNYLKNGPKVPPTSQFNYKGRAYPDVALVGYNYQVFIGGTEYGLSGTSASSPTFAAMISLINGARLNAGKKSLGFLNPYLYNIAASVKGVFRDVTVGENNCCAAQSNPTCCQYGFTAAVGWDPLTGLGSVNFVPLAQALAKV